MASLPWITKTFFELSFLKGICFKSCFFSFSFFLLISFYSAHSFCLTQDLAEAPGIVSKINRVNNYVVIRSSILLFNALLTSELMK